MKKRKAAKRWRTLVVALCTLALAVTPMFAAWGDDVSYGEMRATAQNTTKVNKTVDGVVYEVGTKINSFTLNNTFNYTALDNVNSLDASTLQDIVRTRLLPQWSPIAAGVFRDQAGQLVDLYGEEPNGGNMSQTGFDRYFNMNHADQKYKDETWSMYSLESKLRQVNASHAGDRGWDQLTVTGLKRISNLSEARNLMGQALRDCEKTNAVSAQEFLDADEAGETRLDELDGTEATTGFANVVTAVNCKGSSANFDYVSFGIVFYDFEPVPVAATGLEYVNDGFTTTPDQNPRTNHSEVTNNSTQNALHSAVLGDAVTQTTSTELSALASFELSENIGANIGCSQTESSSETSFWSDDDFGVGSSTSTSSESVSMGLDWGTAWKMAGSLGAKAGHSESEEVSKAVETTIALPPHTGTTLTQETSTTTYSQSYKQPVVLSYKVAIYAMSGDFYSSSAFGGIGGINTGDYDKQSLVIKFDTIEKEKLSYGCAATDDLYYRVANNNKVDRYDVHANRVYSTHSTASGWSKSEEINWQNVINKANDYYSGPIRNVGVNSAADLAKKNFFYETPGKLEVKKDKTTSKVEETYPLYNLATVKTPKAAYTLYQNNTLDLDSLTLQAFNKYGVAFFGFTSDLGQWKLFDNENKALVNNGILPENDNGYPFTYDRDTHVLSPRNTVTQKQTIYLKWEFNQGATAKTGETESQTLADLNDGVTVNAGTPEETTTFNVPIVRIDILNSGLDDPKVTASGSYTGFYKTPINLNDVMKYEVTSKFDKVVDTRVKWEARDEGNGIVVNAGTGEVTFSEPGTYKVRPYIVSNKPEEVYPMNGSEYEWLTVTATEHNLTYYEKKDPTDCTGGDAYGWIGHYRCADCGKYFLDAAGTLEVQQSKVIINPPGHDWGEWTATDDPAVEQRVCKNYSNHVQTRDVYTVTFDVNKPAKATAAPAPVPKAQTFYSDTKASVKVPNAKEQPVLAGYTFEGWCEDKEGNTPYDFSKPVSGSMTLYAKWAPIKYTIATTAVVNETTTDKDGGSQQIISPAIGSSIVITGYDDTPYTDEEHYTYYYKQVEAGDTIELTVTPVNEKFGLEEIWAIPVLAISETDASTGEPFEPTLNETSGKYEITMPASDVAVVGAFAQEWVDVTYVPNKPSDATADVVGIPETNPARIKYGSKPTLPAVTLEGYTFGGWFADENQAEYTKPCLTSTAITTDTTLHAKWIPTVDPPTMRTVTYTLLYDKVSEDAPDVASYQVEDNSTVYNPTEDVYALAGADAQAKYKLLEGDKSCWFKGGENTPPDFETAASFDFNDGVTENIYLYAQVVPQTYTVTYYDGETKLGSQEVEYGKPIKQADADAMAPTKKGQTLSGWTTKGALWNFEQDTVTSNLALYAAWTYDVTFDVNSHGKAPEAQAVESGKKATKPADPTAEGYAFGGWFTDAACTKPYDFDTPVTESLTLYAKWTANKCIVTFDANGHGATPDAQTVDYDAKVTKPADLTADGYTFGGWFTDATCTKAYDFEAAVKGNMRLYAKWTADNKEPQPEPQPDPDHRTKLAPATWDRLWGETALDTMSFIVEAGSFGSGGTVVLATFDGYWDALTAAGIAGKLNAPVLMTPSGELAAQTRTELAALKPSRIVVCGGTAALPDSVANEAAAISGAQVVRCAGQTAVNTAESIAAEAQRLSEQAWADTAFLCTNDGYWDALAAAPISYAKNMPIFLVNGHDTVEASTLDAMRAAGVTKVCLVGGEAAISPAAEQAVRDAGFDVATRLGGATAIETSEKVASYGLSLGMTADYMGVATVNGYWDALAGAPLCGKKNSVLVLVAGSDSHSISGFIKEHDLNIVSGYVFGGRAAIDEATNDAILAATATVPGSDLVAASVAGL